MTDAGPIRLTVPSEQDGRSVLAIAARALGDEALAREVLARGGLWRNRARVTDASLVAHAGDTLFIHRPPGGAYAEVALGAEHVLHEDDDLLAVDKPAGVYVESTPWDAHGHLRGAVEHLLAARTATGSREENERAQLSSRDVPALPSQPAAASVAKVHLVHRLDRDTTGVLLLSKDPAVNPALQRAFEAGAVHKEYVCVCVGEPLEDTFVVETGHGRSRQGLFRVYPLEEVGKELPNGSRVKSMVTRFEVERRLDGATMLRAFPITGRTHQIRLHLAHLGHPLLGDARYGGPAEWRGATVPHHLLHAARLELPHPRTGELLVIRAPLPAWWAVFREGDTLPDPPPTVS
ncbi:MAG: hypothetical protein RLZZ387_1903 [Chloroflexota bacterium]